MGVREWCDRRVGPVGMRQCRCAQYWVLCLGTGCTEYPVHVYCGTGSPYGPGCGLGHLALLGHMRMGAAVFVSQLDIDRHPAIWAVCPPFSPEEGRLGCAATGPLGTERRRLWGRQAA